MAIIARVAYVVSWRSPDTDAAAHVVVVQSGDRVVTIAESLKEQALIGSPELFRLMVRITGTGTLFRSGSFTLFEGMSYTAIMGVLTTPQSAQETSLTIPEGYTRAQIGQAVQAAFPHITQDEWQQATGANSPFKQDEAFVDLLSDIPADASLEGYLFPETYRFFVNASAEDIVRKMLTTLKTRVTSTDLKTQSTAHGLSFHQAMTLASIVEREVRAAEEMRMVADLFYKRLEIGMALQADSTVNYAIGGNSPSVSYDDLETDSPYNTYKYPGLPPGPISNPGEQALYAVAHPKANPYYYFLTSPDGTVYYARTFEEHLENRRLYLR